MHNPLGKQPTYNFGMAPPSSLASSAALTDATLPTSDSVLGGNSMFTVPHSVPGPPSFGHRTSFGGGHDGRAPPPPSFSHAAEKRKAAPLSEKAGMPLGGASKVPKLQKTNTLQQLPRQGERSGRERDVLGGVSTHPQRSEMSAISMPPMQPPLAPTTSGASTHTHGSGPRGVFDLNRALRGTVMLEDDSHTASPTGTASDKPSPIEV